MVNFYQFIEYNYYLYFPILIKKGCKQAKKNFQKYNPAMIILFIKPLNLTDCNLSLIIFLIF